MLQIGRDCSIFGSMKKFFKIIRKRIYIWRNRRLYHRLFWFYAAKYDTPQEAGEAANWAYEWLKD